MPLAAAIGPTQAVGLGALKEQGMTAQEQERRTNIEKQYDLGSLAI